MFKRKKTKKVAVVPVSIIFTLMQDMLDINAPVLDLKISFNDKMYRMGIASDYNAIKNVFFDTVFFVGDDCKRPWESGANYDTLDDFKKHANLGGILLADITDKITIIKEKGAGCPSSITQLMPYIVEKEREQS